MAGVAVLGGIITYLISKIRWTSLNQELDIEYGKQSLSKHVKKNG
ncbi:hypothetical protein [Clostridium sp. CAG:43]|nr:hypothetical protein [Clostridium sp. CAG:43]